MSKVERLYQARQRFLDLLDDHSCLDTSRLTRAIYSSDASIYRLLPLIVATPRTKKEALDIIRTALKAELPITARGAGTSCAGNAIGEGLIVDFSVHLNTILDLDTASGIARVEPGVVQAQLQRQAQIYGWRYGPDPSTANRCTIGGMIGNNACGPRALGYGKTSDTLVSLDLLTAHGDLLRITKDKVFPIDDEGKPLGSSSDFFDSFLSTIDRFSSHIDRECGRFSRQVSGYSFEHLIHGDFARFFAGTEGTLGIVIEASVQLSRDPSSTLMVALGYQSMPLAADDMPIITTFSPTACEGLDRRLLSLVEQRGGCLPPLPDGDAWTLVELGGNSHDECRRRAAALIDQCSADEAWIIDNPDQARRLWTIRSDAAGLAGVALDNPAHAGWEDAAVPVAYLGDYLREFDRLLDRYDLHALPYGHFGEGCVHCRIDFPFARPDGAEVFSSFMVDAARLIARFNGSLSGEHGDGRARSELLEIIYSPQIISLMKETKDLFDPKRLFNPGVIVDPDSLTDDIRWMRAAHSSLMNSHEAFSAHALRCTGVGKCIAASSASQVMCPSFEASGQQHHSTRGRARVLQELIDSSLISRWDSPEVTQALEMCLACKGCRRDCPTGVDMASLKSQVLSHRYRGRLRPPSHYSMGWLPLWGRIIQKFRLGSFVNSLINLPGLSHLIRWMGGIDPARPIPTFRSDGLASSRIDNPPSAHNPPVAVWVDSFNDAFSTPLVNATVQLLKRLGFDVRIISSAQACCGLTWITTGQRDKARSLLTRSLETLYPIAQASIPIIGLEPSCLAVWFSDVDELIDDERIDTVRSSMRTLAQFLNDIDEFTIPDLSDLTLIVQPHCHHRSVMGWEAEHALLTATKAHISTLKGCCGLAGNFGIEKGHYDFSVSVAQTHLLSALDQADENTLILADGFSCRKQISDLRSMRSLSLAELMIFAMDRRSS